MFINKNWFVIWLRSIYLSNYCKIGSLAHYLLHIIARSIISTYLFGALEIKNSFNIAYRGPGVAQASFRRFNFCCCDASLRLSWKLHATRFMGVATVSTFATKLQRFTVQLDVNIEVSVRCLSSPLPQTFEISILHFGSN